MKQEDIAIVEIGDLHRQLKTDLKDLKRCYNKNRKQSLKKEIEICKDAIGKISPNVKIDPKRFSAISLDHSVQDVIQYMAIYHPDIDAAKRKLDEVEFDIERVVKYRMPRFKRMSFKYRRSEIGKVLLQFSKIDELILLRFSESKSYTGKRKQIKISYGWIMDEYLGPFSFTACCETQNVDPKTFRELIRKLETMSLDEIRETYSNFAGGRYEEEEQPENEN